MPEIKGFAGWRYNVDKIQNPAKVLAPPYDVISKKEQEALHRQNPYNVIRLILGKELKGDSSKNNKYTRAWEFLNQWSARGVLKREDSLAFLFDSFSDGFRDKLGNKVLELAGCGFSGNSINRRQH